MPSAKLIELEVPVERAFLVAVDTGAEDGWSAEDSLAELANLAVDQCELVEQRFTMIAADNYRSDLLEVRLWGKRGEELATESLYVDEDDSAL